MWKKENTPSTHTEENKSSNSFESSFSRPEPQSMGSSSASTATIGHTITINGKIYGDEDLTIQGKIKGEIRLSKNTLSIGRNGSVDASILAKIVKVEGEVKGDIEGSERVIISESGRVYGNIKSPRVVLKDGSRFKGNIDMQQEDGTKDNKPAGSDEAAKTPTAAAPASTASTPTQNKPNPAIPNNTNNQGNKVGDTKKIDLRNL